MNDEELIDHLAAGHAALTLASRVLALLVQGRALTQDAAVQVLKECAENVRKLDGSPYQEAATKLEALVLGYQTPPGPRQ